MIVSLFFFCWCKYAESRACLVEFHTLLALLLVTGCLLCEQENVAVEFMEVFVVASMATVSRKMENRTGLCGCEGTTDVYFTLL